MQHISVAVHITTDTVICYDHEPSFCYKVDAKTFTLSNQLSNFPKNLAMQRYRAEFRQFNRLILPNFCYSHSKKAIIPTIFSRKHLKFLEISLDWKQ